MSKIVYLLGAGASYGTRRKNLNGLEIQGAIVRGIPVVNELGQCIEDVLSNLGGYFVNTISYKVDPAIQEYINKANSIRLGKIKNELYWLKNICEQYPTIDTYAKQLYVTEGINGKNYIKLKKALSLFFTIVQFLHGHDLRYDSFIASIISTNNCFPNNISILSWNYDFQFEAAYSGYMPRKNFSEIYHALNTFYKFTQESIDKTNFGIIKLNGTALLDKSSNLINPLIDREKNVNPLENISDLYFNDPLAINTLSFAWESSGKLIESIKGQVKDADTVVVIGYSFPYVNRVMDKIIFQNIDCLRKLYLQGPNTDEMEDNVIEVLTDIQLHNSMHPLKIFKKNFLNQFYIPSNL